MGKKNKSTPNTEDPFDLKKAISKTRSGSSYTGIETPANNPVNRLGNQFSTSKKDSSEETPSSLINDKPYEGFNTQIQSIRDDVKLNQTGVQEEIKELFKSKLDSHLYYKIWGWIGVGTSIIIGVFMKYSYDPLNVKTTKNSDQIEVVSTKIDSINYHNYKTDFRLDNFEKIQTETKEELKNLSSSPAITSKNKKEP